MNPQLGTIRTVLMRSYVGLPYRLKSCFLYMPIFPEDHRVGRGRLARRWSAEGYSREVRGKSAEEIADSYFMELISRSMILPSQQSTHSRKGIDSCQVHDLMREIGISKSMEENLVFTLEQGCGSNTQVTARHLAISRNWKGDQDEFKSIINMSRVRSMTCFGKWRPFFISEEMRLLRVLDLEDATDVSDHHLKHIGKFLHLRYLSLRGCGEIRHLPDSFGNLRQLETLDIRDTLILMLPQTIIKLQKLKTLRASIFERPADLSVYDVCTMFCCNATHGDSYGVLVPRGMKNLKSLQTLDAVNIRQRCNVFLQEIKGLTRLRKLGVTGVNKENSQELCSAIVDLSRLESVSIRSEGEPCFSGCLDGTLSFPENLQSLKLYGNMVKLPEWIEGLKNLAKLKLQSSMLSETDACMRVLGVLPNLAFLHLLQGAFHHSAGESLHLNFPPECFPSLVVLDVKYIYNLRSVKFEQGATPKLELLELFILEINDGSLTGLPSLFGLKEFVLNRSYEESELQYLQDQLAQNPNRPVLKCA